MDLKELKQKSPVELLSYAESLEVENASTMNTQELMYAILKRISETETTLYGDGVLEILPDGFGFLRAPESNYLAGPDDIYVAPNQIKRFGLKTGDTVEGEIHPPKSGEKYFAISKINTVNGTNPEELRYRANFDNLTPLFPNEKLKMEYDLNNILEL